MGPSIAGAASRLADQDKPSTTPANRGREVRADRVPLWGEAILCRIMGGSNIVLLRRSGPVSNIGTRFAFRLCQGERSRLPSLASIYCASVRLFDKWLGFPCESESQPMVASTRFDPLKSYQLNGDSHVAATFRKPACPRQRHSRCVGVCAVGCGW